jgi:hypothetical protein
LQLIRLRGKEGGIAKNIITATIAITATTTTTTTTTTTCSQRQLKRPPTYAACDVEETFGFGWNERVEVESAGDVSGCVVVVDGGGGGGGGSGGAAAAVDAVVFVVVAAGAIAIRIIIFIMITC